MEYEIKRMKDGCNVFMEVKSSKEDEIQFLIKDIECLRREVKLVNEENDYIRRTMKNELLSWIPVVISHLYKDDNKFDSTMYNQALDDAKIEINRWLK